LKFSQPGFAADTTVSVHDSLYAPVAWKPVLRVVPP
jgi:hypothetical protein